MGFLSDLFKNGEDPLPVFTDPLLGKMEWSKDDEAWLGARRQVKFGLAYDRKSSPAAELIAYAHQVLCGGAWMENSLAEAKQRARQEYPQAYHEEIQGLTWGTVHFYLHKGTRRIIADLEGGRDDRAWRIEYHDRECEGIGFDD